MKFPCAGELDGNVREDDAYIIGWWLTDAWKHKDGKACMFSQSKPTTLNKLRNWFDTHNIKYSEYIKQRDNENQNDEHTFYVTGELADKLLSQYPTRELSWDMLNWDRESRELLLEGLMDGDGSYRCGSGYSRTFWSKKQERCDIVQAICLSLNYRSYLNYKDNEISGVNFNIAHNSTETQTKHRKPNVKYCGKVYCLQTETGAFVVRRNGKAFISGNSGFPKSMNLGKSIEAKLTTGSANTQEFKNLNGTKVEKGNWGIARNAFDYGARPSNYDEDGCLRTDKVDFTTEEARRWKGWGTSIKPAYEPIIVARKPCIGSTTDNILKYGVGGINIDECRVGTETIGGGTMPSFRDVGKKSKDSIGIDKLSFGQVENAERVEYDTHEGRFPSNIILTYDETDKDEVCGGFPNSKSQVAVGVKRNERDINQVFNSSNCGFNNKVYDESRIEGYADEGSAARYFYTAKASKRDRDEGLDGFEEKKTSVMVLNDNVNNDGDFTGMWSGRNTKMRNIHPTVKPTDLMSYLVRLVTPDGGTILDPFNGSGSTGKGAMWENRDRGKDYKYVGIELSEEYLAIAKARIEYVLNCNEPCLLDVSDDETAVETKHIIRQNNLW